jgi:hypothetical protein
LSLPEKSNKTAGFPDGVNFISFAFNYDVTQALADLPREKVWEICRKRSWKTKKKIKAPVYYDDIAIDYVKSKSFKLWKLRDPDHPTKDKLDKNGNPILGPTESPNRKSMQLPTYALKMRTGFVNHGSPRQSSR